jgi:predicted ribosomally synthesized peptide with nif11-like leader
VAVSQQQARAFVERMKTDEAFATRVLAVEGAKERQAFIRGEGYDCSADEIAAQGGMLTEEELSSVSARVRAARRGAHAALLRLVRAPARHLRARPR